MPLPEMFRAAPAAGAFPLPVLEDIFSAAALRRCTHDVCNAAREVSRQRGAHTHAERADLERAEMVLTNALEALDRHEPSWWEHELQRRENGD